MSLSAAVKVFARPGARDLELQAKTCLRAPLCVVPKFSGHKKIGFHCCCDKKSCRAKKTSSEVRCLFFNESCLECGEYDQWFSSFIHGLKRL